MESISKTHQRGGRAVNCFDCFKIEGKGGRGMRAKNIENILSPDFAAQGVSDQSPNGMHETLNKNSSPHAAAEGVSDQSPNGMQETLKTD